MLNVTNPVLLLLHQQYDMLVPFLLFGHYICYWQLPPMQVSDISMVYRTGRAVFTHRPTWDEARGGIFFESGSLLYHFMIWLLALMIKGFRILYRVNVIKFVKFVISYHNSFDGGLRYYLAREELIWHGNMLKSKLLELHIPVPSHSFSRSVIL